MGEAKRRRAAASASRDLNAEIGAVFDEAGAGRGKVLSVEFLYASQAPAMLRGLLGGDPYVGQMLALVSDTVDRVGQSEDRGEPMLCLLCDHEFTRRFGGLPTALVVLSAFRQDRSRAIVHGLCRACAGAAVTEELKDRVQAKLFESYGIKDGRLVPTPDREPGHA
jgi:hypothetical protein